MNKPLALALFTCTLVTVPAAMASPMDVYCTIRASGGNLDCQILGKERKVMNAEDVTLFIDSSESTVSITMKSRKGLERIFFVDGKAPQFKRLNEIKKSAPISEISDAKLALFREIEKKVIKLSDELDGQATAAELVLYDSSLTLEKTKRETRVMTAELDGFRKNKDKVCTTTPAFEQITKANAKLQQTLSNILYAFQAPDTCMSEFKVFKDRDGTVDLRQLEHVSDVFRSSCLKK